MANNSECCIEMLNKVDLLHNKLDDKIISVAQKLTCYKFPSFNYASSGTHWGLGKHLFAILAVSTWSGVNV